MQPRYLLLGISLITFRKRSALVKVPLNCITPVELRKILLVRGISDWSVERIVEQTIACSGIALLHLEENPGTSMC